MRFCSYQKTTMNEAGNREDLWGLLRKEYREDWMELNKALWGMLHALHEFPPEIYARLRGSRAQYIFTFCNCGRVVDGVMELGFHTLKL